MAVEALDEMQNFDLIINTVLWFLLSLQIEAHFSNKCLTVCSEQNYFDFTFTQKSVDSDELF